MLDLDHPMTEFIFAAASATDRLLIISRYMTLTSTGERQNLLQQCQEPLDSLRRLNNAHFGASSFIAEAIAELENSLDGLGQLRTKPFEGSDYAIISCPACGKALTKYHAAYASKPEHRWSVWCADCLKITSAARRKLDSSEGFGTWLI